MSDTFRTDPRSGLFLIVIGVLTALGPFAIDMYLPAMPHLVEAFGTSSARVQWTLSSYFVGLSVGQLIFGNASDRFGRRPALLAGIALYLASSLAASTSTSVEALIIARVFQGLGAAGGTVITRAAIRDVYHGNRAARAMTLVMTVMAVAPLLAPMLGSYLLLEIGWRAIFWFMFAVGVLCVILTIFVLPETLPPALRVHRSQREQLRKYGLILADKNARHFILCGSLNTGLLFAFIASSSFVFVDHFGLTETQFSMIFGSTVLGLVVGNLLNSRYVERFGFVRFLGVGIALSLVSSASILVLHVAGVHHPLAVAIPMLGIAATVGVVSGNSLAGLLEEHAAHAGAASALFGVCQYSSGAAATALVGIIDDPVLSMSLIMTIAASTSLFTWTRIRVGAEFGGTGAA